MLWFWVAVYPTLFGSFLGNMWVFIFIFPTTQPALWRSNNPSKPQEREGKGKHKPEREKVHTQFYFYQCVHSAAHMDYIYVVCVETKPGLPVLGREVIDKQGLRPF